MIATRLPGDARRRGMRRWTGASPRSAVKPNARRLMRRYSLSSHAGPTCPCPEKFRNLPAGTVFDYTAETSRNWQN